MDVKSVSSAIADFLKKHKQTFYSLSTNQSKALELAVAVGVAEHYRAKKFSVSVHNPIKSPTHFVVKTSTKGYPWNFSHFKLERDGFKFEAHMNLMVRSAHDPGHYCVDVGVVNAGRVPDSEPKGKWKCLPNGELVTFAEVKKLVVYPMLLAQFVGIVHEIKPRFIGGRLPRGFAKMDHLPPALASLGHFSGNSKAIADSYPQRKIKITIAPNFDIRLAKVVGKHQTSPFEAAEE